MEKKCHVCNVIIEVDSEDNLCDYCRKEFELGQKGIIEENIEVYSVNDATNVNQHIEESLNFFENIVAFIFPIFGFILYMMYKNEQGAQSLRNNTKYGIYFNVIIFFLLLFILLIKK